MANQLGHSGPSPRCNDQHLRHSSFARVRHSLQLKTFLAEQATRLSETSTLIFGKLKKNTAQAVRKAASYSDLA